MKTIYFLIILCFIGVSASYSQRESRIEAAKDLIMSPEILNSLERINEFKVSPDGKWILFTKAIPDIKANKNRSDIYAIRTDGSQQIRVTDNDFSEWNIAWVNAGKIAFISTEKGGPEVYFMDFPKGTPTQITAAENGVSGFKISPDGKYIAYASEVKVDSNIRDMYPQFDKAKVRIYDDLPARHWDDWVDDMYSHIFIQELGVSKPIDIMLNEPYDSPLKPFGGIEEFDWAPNSQELAYTSKKVPNFEWTTNSAIYIYKLGPSDKKSVNITTLQKGYDKSPMYSPDGRWIAYHSMERDGFESDRVRLMLYNRLSGETRELSKTLDQWVENTVWSPDSRYLYFSAGDSGTVQLYRIDLNGAWQQFTNGIWNYDAGLEITPDGKTLIAGKRTMQRPTEIYSVNIADGSDKKLTGVNDSIYIRLKPVKIEQRWIKSPDGSMVHTWILYPPDFDSTKKYPMITYLQGGPQSTISQYFSYRWNYYIMASQGFVVVAPNRRGVPGFGQAWNDAISKDWGGKPMEDVLAATDAMLKEPYIDKKGLSAVGASAGGYQAFWLAGNHNKRFSAFIAHCGVFNMESMYGSTEELWFPNWEYGGPYWENKDFYKKHSPHSYAANWDTPILISTGERDFRVPYTQSLEAFTVAQVKGIPSKLVVFPEENHWILHPQEAIIWQHEFFDFLNKYTKHNN